MKQFYILYGIGKCKYVVNYHDGEKKHTDGSNFFDVTIFSNKKKLGKFIRNLVELGYIQR